MKKITPLFLLISTLFSLSAWAEDISYEQYKAEQAAEYQDYLKQNWEAFEVFKADRQAPRPKPKVQPLLKESGISIKPTTAPPVLPRDSVDEFMGHPVPVTPEGLPPSLKLNQIEKPALTAFWLKAQEFLRQSGLKEELLHYRQQYRLGDWAYFQLVKHISERISPNTLSAQALSWVSLTESGYDARLGYNNNQLSLLLPVKEKVYGVNYLTIGQRRFYMFWGEIKGQLFTYRQPYGQGKQQLRVNFLKTMRLPRKRLSTRRFEFEEDRKIKHYEAVIDLDHNRLIQSYPQIEMVEYFKAPLPDLTAASLSLSSRKLVGEQRNVPAINTLLTAVQQGIAYQVDEEQFGYENYMTAEELLYHGTGDCEDRSALLSWMIRNVLKFDTVILSYPEHVALGIKGKPIKGEESVSYRGKSYVVADPSYLGAAMGQVIPQVRGENPVTIEF